MKLEVRDSQPKQMNKRIVLNLKNWNIQHPQDNQCRPFSAKIRVFATCPCFSLQVALTDKPFHSCNSFCAQVSHCSSDNSSCWWLTRSCCLSTNSESVSLWIPQMSLWGGTENMEEIALSMRLSAFLSAWCSLLSCLLRDTHPCKCPRDEEINTYVCSTSLHSRAL